MVEDLFMVYVGYTCNGFDVHVDWAINYSQVLEVTKLSDDVYVTRSRGNNSIVNKLHSRARHGTKRIKTIRFLQQLLQTFNP